MGCGTHKRHMIAVGHGSTRRVNEEGARLQRASVQVLRQQGQQLGLEDRSTWTQLNVAEPHQPITGFFHYLFQRSNSLVSILSIPPSLHSCAKTQTTRHKPEREAFTLNACKLDSAVQGHPGTGAVPSNVITTHKCNTTYKCNSGESSWKTDFSTQTKARKSWKCSKILLIVLSIPHHAWLAPKLNFTRIHTHSD